MNRPLAIILFCLFAFSTLASAEEEYREFTSKSGQTMMARPVAVIGENVRIQREDGAEFTCETSLFAPEDEKYLNNWMLRHQMESGRLLKINTKQGNSKRNKIDQEGIEIWNWLSYYNIDIENLSDMPLNNVKVEYTFFVFDDDIAAQDRQDGRIDKHTGDFTIKILSPRRTSNNKTKTAKMQKSELDSNYYYAGGGDDESEDHLEGIHLKIYIDGMFIGEHSDPKGVLEKFK